MFRIAVITFILVSATSSATAKTKTRLVDIDLGASTLDHLDVEASPLRLGIGLFDRTSVQTILPLWFIWTAAKGNVIPNVSTKTRVYRRGKFSSAFGAGWYWLRLNDLDGDGTNVAAWIAPFRATATYRWERDWPTTLELSLVWAHGVGEVPFDSDATLYGVAIARSSHIGVIQRYRFRRWFSVWVRGRALIGHSPIVVRANTEIGEDIRLNIRARSNANLLTSGFSAVGGVHFDWSWGSFLLGGGYGTWFLPWIYLPVGEAGPIFDANFRVRFRTLPR